MRETLKGISLLVAALFLFSAVTPDPQDYQSTAGCSTFIDDDFALCSGFTTVGSSHHRTERLPLLQQALFAPSPVTSNSPSRAPPSCLSATS
jgi:hypothetical protein